MRLLIDTHALIWFCEGNAILSQTARAAMLDESNERFISHATSWEMAIKFSLRKLDLKIDYETFFPGVLEANGFQLLPSCYDHYQALINLPFHHRDPFDRLLIAQAQVEKLTLITCDPEFATYDVPLLW